jgi:hypothetical protein
LYQSFSIQEFLAIEVFGQLAKNKLLTIKEVSFWQVSYNHWIFRKQGDKMVMYGHLHMKRLVVEAGCMLEVDLDTVLVHGDGGLDPFVERLRGQVAHRAEVVQEQVLGVHPANV